jgi:tRNA 2-thiouridine synthesizing protein D
MKFGILILDGPYQHQAADSAYHFAKAVLAKGHEIVTIFFYQDGVINATKLMDVPQDDRHIGKRWAELGAQGVDIVACIASAKRRGIVDDITIPNVRISGLGQLVELIIESDRLITFGG